MIRQRLGLRKAKLTEQAGSLYSAGTRKIPDLHEDCLPNSKKVRAQNMFHISVYQEENGRQKASPTAPQLSLEVSSLLVNSLKKKKVRIFGAVNNGLSSDFISQC